MKECPNCKTILEDDELFCHECGTKYMEEVKPIRVIPGLNEVVVKHLSAVLQKPGKVVSTLLHPQLYPKAAIQLITDDEVDLGINIALEKDRGEETLLSRLKESDYYTLFVSDKGPNDELYAAISLTDDDFCATMPLKNDKEEATRQLSGLLTSVYEQPLDMVPAYEVQVNGREIASSKSKKVEISIPEDSVNDQKQDEGKKCIHCGELIEDDCAFCPYCGGKVPEEQPAQSEQLEVEPQQEGKTQQDAIFKNEVEPQQEEKTQQEAVSQKDVEPQQEEMTNQEKFSQEKQEAQENNQKNDTPESDPEVDEFEDDDIEKKSKKWIFALIALLIIAGAAGGYFLFCNKSPELKAAEADKELYEKNVEKCRIAINSADSFAELEEAKERLYDIENMEDAHSSLLPEVYCQFGKLMEFYNDKVEMQRQKYIDLADEKMNKNDCRAAYDLLKHASDALPKDKELQRHCYKIAKAMGYIYVTDIQFANCERDGTDIDPAGSTLHSDKMRYLYPKVIYNSLLPLDKHNVKEEFYYKIFSPNGFLDCSSNSPSGYTNKGGFYIAPGERQQGEWLNGWGHSATSTYEAGNYTFELYYNDLMIYNCEFTIY